MVDYGYIGVYYAYILVYYGRLWPPAAKVYGNGNFPLYREDRHLSNYTFLCWHFLKEQGG